MWISFPITRNVREIVPWILIPYHFPLYVVGWVFAAWFAVLRWIWRDRDKPPSSGDTIRITIRS